MEQEKVSIREVARHAGVSLGTVSNVLNKPSLVSDRSRKKVERAMQQLHYIPSRAAGQLRSQKSSLVGVAVPDVGNPYWASVVRGIETVCDRNESGIIVSSIHQDPLRQSRVFMELMRQGVDGLIVAPIDTFSESLQEFRSRLGIVSIGESPLVRSIDTNSKEGMVLVTNYLLDLGHRHIAFINGRKHVSWCQARFDGIIEALRKRNLDPTNHLFEYTVDDLTTTYGREGARKIINAHPEVTAIICANDSVALGALLELKEAKLNIPQDISVVGYDDVEFAAALSPSLTTVRQQSYEIGVKAAQMLFDTEELMDLEDLPFPPQLVIRDSTRKI